MSWDSGNNAGGDGSWGAPAASGGNDWNAGGQDWNAGSTPWGESTADAAANTGGDSWNAGGATAATTTNDSQWATGGYNADTGYDNSGYADNSGYDERPKNTPRPGDWDCPSCGQSNFRSRQECFKCNEAKPEGLDDGAPPRREPRPGDWDCPSCSVSNFRSRQECFKCGEPKPEGLDSGLPPPREPRPGDWDCPSCSINNFRSRTECFKCGAARPEGVGLPDDGMRAYNWASNRARYEFNENAVDADGMAPRDEKLEAELFGLDPTEQHTPLDFTKYANIPVSVERGEAPEPVTTFDAADLHPVMKENVRLAGYAQPTPVQQYSIPIVTGGKDLMACAQTGSGKTAAFLMPVLSRLFNQQELAQPRPGPFVDARSFRAEPLVVIIAPTRELCSQIFDECRKFTYRSRLRPCAVYGGADTGSQLRQLERGCDILAAVPGRLMNFIERGKIGLNRVKYLVLDEADRMLDMGFEGVIRAIVEKRGLSAERQTLMYSATFPRAIRKLARDFLRPDYVFLKVGRVGGTTSSIKQTILYVEEENKRETLRNLLNSQPPSRTLIFVETKRSADSLDQFLFQRDFPSTSIHGDRNQMEREDALKAFKAGQCPILVATAVAARGIDIRNVMHVINYDMPDNMDEYIHRIGRTARVGRTGLATSFYNDNSYLLAPELTKLLTENKQEIPEFLQQYVTDEIVWEEDLDEETVERPSYAGQEYVPMDQRVPGAEGAEGDWPCPSCHQSNFARRTECFKCNTPRPEGMGAPSGGPPRREGDWNCPSCNVSNFASRYECFKCGTAKPEDSSAGGADAYGASASGGDWNNGGGATWDAGAAAASWDQPAAATEGGASWGEPAPAAPAAPAAAGWGEPAPAASAAPAAASSGAGWGESAPAAPAAAGWGEPAPAAAAAPAAAGWGEPAPAAQSAPAAQPTPATQPAPASNGWGAPAPAAQATPASNGWGAPAPAAQATPASNGWGAPAPAQPVQPAAPVAAPPAAAPAPAPAPPVAEMNNLKVDNAPSGGDGWGAPPAQTSGDGWGAPPSQTSGAGWG